MKLMSVDQVEVILDYQLFQLMMLETRAKRSGDKMMTQEIEEKIAFLKRQIQSLNDKAILCLDDVEFKTKEIA